MGKSSLGKTLLRRGSAASARPSVYYPPPSQIPPSPTHLHSLLKIPPAIGMWFAHLILAPNILTSGLDTNQVFTIYKTTLFNQCAFNTQAPPKMGKYGQRYKSPPPSLSPPSSSAALSCPAHSPQWTDFSTLVTVASTLHPGSRGLLKKRHEIFCQEIS